MAAQFEMVEFSLFNLKKPKIKSVDVEILEIIKS
jgi:hypothetical protein